ncbi:MAG: glycine--tRNA ligase [Parachlamydiaceae bacterium]|nr:glycine--tRNA ligase [Parachlamydiaceae bacterium]
MENKQSTEQDSLKAIVALCKRRGFIYPGSDLYGGFANTYSYGPYGVELKKNIKDLWWKRFVQFREDMVGLDGPILLHPRAWEASGHVEGFNDALIDCKSCKSRFRVDHLIESTLKMDVEGLSVNQLNEIVQKHQLSCPKCEAKDWTEARYFNLMFTTKVSKTSQNENDGIAYLRPETAQAIFLDFKNIIDTVRVQVPFGVGQIGKAFRNEITPGNFIFRVIEFEQMEIEYFIPPQGWEEYFEKWLKEMQSWCDEIGLEKSNLTLFEHPKEKLSHYSKRTVDIMYKFPFGVQELYGLAYRTNFDLTRHSEFAKAKIEYTDPKTNEKWIPHVIEPTFGLDRTILAILCQAYEEETLPDGETRTVLHLPAKLAPVKAAIFPLMKKENLTAKARTLYEELRNHWNVQYDEMGAIGKRYRRHDEIGTPFCITIDYDTLENNTVTIRDRDTMKQERVEIENVAAYIFSRLK